MSNDLKAESAYYTEVTLREHLMRANRVEPPAKVKQGTYTEPTDPTWKPKPPREPKPITKGYSRDPKLCKHQWAGGRRYCPYCGLTNPRM